MVNAECMYEGCNERATQRVTITDYLGADWNSMLCKHHATEVLTAMRKG